jgi:N-acetylglucosaminyl-diphospho-decaprenol L-rhamnosyltransferase
LGDYVQTSDGNGLAAATAVVVNWNLADMTLRCVAALAGDGMPLERIVVVDNGSIDDSVPRLERELPECRLVRLPSNVGYARAANAGARELAGKTYIFVNNDAFVDEAGSLARLVAALERDRVGLAVPRLLNEDRTLQPSVVPLTTPANALVRATGLSRWIPNRWQPRWSTHWDHSQSRAVDAANGTVVAVRGELWRELGGYAERDWMFSEDIDLCWRARKRGLRTWFERDAVFVHLGNATGAQAWSDSRRAEMVSRSDGAMIRTELDPARATATIGFIIVGLAARAVAWSLVGNRTRARCALASLRGYLRPPTMVPKAGAS